jgi:glycosyltransferase family protein
MECLSCPKEIIFFGLNISSAEDTLDEIIKNNRSISRYGDGEFDLIFGKDIGFQKFNNKLARQLRRILKNKRKDFLVGINIPYNNTDLDKYIYNTKTFFFNWVESYKLKLSTLIDMNKKYYSSYISRFYFEIEDKSKVPDYIKKLKQIWEKKDILIIEGEKSRLGVGNDLFNNSKSIKRIICPSENAFNVYYKIIEQTKKFDKSVLVLLALGPTSTVLAYDLYILGYQAIDIGHIDIEYEWFLRKAKTKIQINNKYVNEVYGKNYNIGSVKDIKYYEEIVSKILN